MNMVLGILGILGLGAMLIAAYVFTVSARNYVSESDPTTPSNSRLTAAKRIKRRATDRREKEARSFPITVNGLLIEADRRTLQDRRLMA
jgi:hypothetical protein